MLEVSDLGLVVRYLLACLFSSSPLSRVAPLRVPGIRDFSSLSVIMFTIVQCDLGDAVDIVRFKLERLYNKLANMMIIYLEKKKNKD